MGNVFTRIKNTVVSDLHQLLDEKEQKNPVAALNQYLRESEQETEKVRKLVERQYRLKEEFIREHHQANEMAQKRMRQAAIASQAGEEQMHQFAMKEYEAYTTRAGRMEQLYQEAATQLDTLEQKYEEMKHRLKDMHMKRMEVMGRENIAKAHYHMNGVLHEAADHSYGKFSDLDQYINNLEYKVNSAYDKNTFDEKIIEIEKGLKAE